MTQEERKDLAEIYYDKALAKSKEELIAIIVELLQGQQKAEIQAVEDFIAFLQDPNTVSTSLEANKEIFLKKLKGEKLPY